MQAWRRYIVAIADASFCGVGWDHAIAGVVEQQSRQQVVGFVADEGSVGPLGEGFLPDCVKQRAIHNWRLLAGQNLILVFDLADIEVVAQQVVQRAATERDAAARLAGCEPFDSGPDVAFFEVPLGHLGHWATMPESETAPARARHRRARRRGTVDRRHDSEYGWEKLFSERLYLAYRRNHGMNTHVARYHNIFGPEGTWTGGREKAPAAICRKVAMARSGDAIEIWGDGKQTRSFLYVD